MIHLPNDSIKLDIHSSFPGLIHIGSIEPFSLMIPKERHYNKNLSSNFSVSQIEYSCLAIIKQGLGCDKPIAYHWEKWGQSIDDQSRNWHLDCSRGTRPKSEWKNEALLIASLTADPSDDGTQIKNEMGEIYTCLSWHVYLMKHMYHRGISKSYKVFLRYGLTLDYEI